jgi:hypothetical protein
VAIKWFVFTPPVKTPLGVDCEILATQAGRGTRGNQADLRLYNSIPLDSRAVNLGSKKERTDLITDWAALSQKEAIEVQQALSLIDDEVETRLRRLQAASQAPAPAQQDPRPQIDVASDIAPPVDALEAALLACADTPLYQRGRFLCHVGKGAPKLKWLQRPPDMPQILLTSAAHLRELASRAATFRVEDARTQTLHTSTPPKGLDHGVGHFRPLSITRQRHWLTYHFIAMRYEGLCQVF